jgi:hypothetical protein
MTDKTNKNKEYELFNIDQIVPILNDLNLAKIVTEKINTTITEYIDSLYEIINVIKESCIITNEIKVRIDRNVSIIINNLDTNLNQMVLFKHLGIKKEKLFERLKRGINYKYKLPNGTVVEYEELLKFDGIKLDSVHRSLEIGDQIFQLSDSSDYIPDSGNNDSDFTVGCDDITPEECVIIVLNRLQREINKSKTVQAYVDVLTSCIKFSIDIIETDIELFDLFDLAILKKLSN